MKPVRIKTIIVILFALALGAGVVLGNLVDLRQLLLGSAPAHNIHSAPGDDSPLGEELALTADQREKMKAIWEGVHTLTDESLRTARKAQEDRDRAIRDLIPQEKIEAYNDLNSNYDKTVATLTGRRQKEFDDAVKKTTEILSPEQGEKYRKILAKRLGSEFGGGHDSIRNLSVTQPG